MLKPCNPHPTEAALEWLADYVIDGETDALDEACAIALHQPVEIERLLAGLDALASQRADAQRLRHARLALRTALQLPLTPGAVCRA
jgi:hypothetical protein